MVKVLTGSEVFEVLEECRANGEVTDYTEGTEQFFELPSQLGQGYWRTVQLRPGIELSMSDLEKRQTHVHTIQQHSQTMPLTLSYYLSGGCSVANDGIKGSIEEVAGKSYLYCLPNTAEIESYEPRQRIRKIRLQILPELIHAFSEELHELPVDIKQVIEQPGKALFHTTGTITPLQQQVLQQIFRCPFQGITRQVYLEAKVLELTALQLDQFIASSGKAPNRLPANDIDRIYQRERLRFAI